MVASHGIIKVPRKRKKKKFLPGKFSIASAYAASEQVISWPNVTTSDTTNELSIQRPKLLSWANVAPNTPQSRLSRSGIRLGASVGPCNASDSEKNSGNSKMNDASTSRKYKPAVLAMSPSERPGSARGVAAG